MIAIVDYGMGNLRSVQKAFERLQQEAVITDRPELVDAASHVVLPGVGAFGQCLRNLRERGLEAPVLQAIDSGRPFLGICIGLQALFTRSHEMGCHAGLGVIEGEVDRLPDSDDIKIPHMGWNALRMRGDSPCLRGVPDGAMMYFVHSYRVLPADESVIAATTTHGVEFVSAVWRDNVFATQFHPEKSSRWGLQILRNFATQPVVAPC